MTMLTGPSLPLEVLLVEGEDAVVLDRAVLPAHGLEILRGTGSYPHNARASTVSRSFLPEVAKSCSITPSDDVLNPTTTVSDPIPDLEV